MKLRMDDYLGREVSAEHFAKVGSYCLAVSLAILLNLLVFFPIFARDYGIDHPLRYLSLFLASAALIISIHGFFNRNHRAVFQLCAADILFLVFLVIILISLLTKATLATNELKFVCMVLAVNVILPYVFARLMNQDGAVLFLKITVVICLLFLILTAVGLSVPSVEGKMAGRLILFEEKLFTPRYLGPLLGTLIVLSVFFVTRPETVQTGRLALIGWLALISITVWMMVYIGARSGIVSAIAVSLLVLVLTKHHAALRRIAIATCLLVTFVFSLWTLPQERMAFYEEIIPGTVIIPKSCNINNDLKTNSVVIRMFLYKEAWNMFVAYPWTGIGAGNFGKMSCYYRNYYKLTGEEGLLDNPHNIYLNVYSELGLLGGGIFSALVVLILVNLWRSVFHNQYERSAKLTIWFLGGVWLFYATRDLFYGAYHSSMPFYLLTGILVALLGYTRDSKV